MLPDDKIGRYRIVSKIGEGGMGEVYLAEDAKLDRRVALKILPAKVATDIDRMLRFEHEAKSASALNHPNIITIYEINDEEGALFIAMEYVEGETLAKRIKSKPFDLRKTLDVAIQIAAALAAAHEANVIHRDIKPDNIIVRPDGLVKVLDFGLAKLTEEVSAYDLEALTTLVKTSPGLIMGTVGYMSPEQARGRNVDGRSDIFSFGSMLYEMLSGKRPFTGDNEVDVIASIIHQEPEPLGHFASNIPHELESLIRKTLRKNRDERYQSMPELLADLKDIRQQITSEINSGRAQTKTSDLDYVTATGEGFARPLTTASPSRFANTFPELILGEARLHPLIAAAIVLIALAAIGFVGSRWYAARQRPESFQTMRFAKLTSTGNVASGSIALSSDGRLFAYVIQEAGEQSLWVKQTATESNVQVVPPADVRYYGITFSPDANHIYYASGEKTGVPSIYQVPALGGTSRKLITDADGPISFSPDGNRLSFVRKKGSLMSADPDGGAVQMIAAFSDGKILNQTSWSPDGNTIVAAVFLPEDSRDHLIEIDVKSGTERPFASPHWVRLRGVAWLPDASGVIVSGRDPDTQLSQIWLISYPGGQSRKVTNDLSSYFGLSLTGDGQTVVSTQQTLVSNLWVSYPVESDTATKITSELGRDEGMSGVAWTPDRKVVYTARIRENQDLWIADRDGSENRQLTFNSKSNFSPVVTPDGRLIIFVSTRAGNPGIWKMDIDGGNPAQLTGTGGSSVEPSLSPDGKWVVYQHVDGDNKSTIRKISIDGGDSVQLTDIESRRPTVSPDGSFFACDFGQAKENASMKLAIIPFDGGPPKRILDLPLVLKSRTFRWSSDGKSMLYSESRNRVDNLWSQPLDGGLPKQLTDFKSDRIFRFDVSHKNDYLAFARGNDVSDVVLINNFR